MYSKDNDKDTIYIGETFQHEIEVKWWIGSYTDDGYSEVRDTRVTLRSKGDYPIDKDVVEHLVETGAIDFYLKPLDLPAIDYLEVEETDWTDYECAINELKDEISALTAKKQQLQEVTA